MAAVDPDEFCHLRREGGPGPACGAESTIKPHRGFWGGERMCLEHGLPMCPVCVQILETWMRSGGWEGAG